MKRNLFLLALALGQMLWSQDRNETYIATYKDIAIAEMYEFGIPASITLAQGILESAGGESYLATKANNHFGIKCHLDWEGKKVYRDDDAKNECFRKYNRAEESFRDHSLFLSQRSRYRFLFDYKRTDYKKWAHGLKKAGYATNPKYPSLLIELIERYELHQYDKANMPTQPSLEDNITVAENRGGYTIHELRTGLKYVEAQPGDTWEDIAVKLTLKVANLLKYNELRHDATLVEGQRLYISKKRKSATQKTYTVQAGETAYGISQKLGIKLAKIYERNPSLDVGEQPKAGDVLKVKWTLF